MDASSKKWAADPRFKILPQQAPAMTDGIAVWRSIRESPASEPEHGSIFEEFPADAATAPDEPSRRHFLKIMGASVALAGTGGCFTQPQETIVPYIRAPEQIVPGRPLYYATAMTYAGASLGLLVETHMGRPTKVEGNPLHPAVPEVMAQANERANDERLRFGATDPFGQAIVLSLYDPDRSQTVLRRGQIDTWEFAYSDLRAQLDRLAPAGGEGLRLLTELVVSPTLADQIQELLAKYPGARWHQYEPVNDDNSLAGARLAFNDDVATSYLNTPDVVLSLDADCIADGPMRLDHARRFRWQYLGPDGAAMSRVYVVETSSTLTGAAADHRLPASPQTVIAFALAVARAFGLELPGAMEMDNREVPKPWLDAVVEDLAASRGRSVVLAGRGQPPLVHAVVHWLNAALDNVGSTIEYRAPTAARPELAVESIRDLAGSMRAKEVEALIILGGNPAYDAPADLEFAMLLGNVPFSLHLSEYANETSDRCGWHVPQAHLFEAWGDTRAADGTVSIVQPLIAPLYGGKADHDVLAALMGNLNATSHDLVRDYWQRSFGPTANADEFERAWKTALHDGILAGTQLEARTPTLRDDFAKIAADVLGQNLTPADKQPLQLSIRPDNSAWDGRFANNGWLQELPRPLTKLTWDNAALMNPRTAEESQLNTGDVVEIETGAGQIDMPVFVVPGHPRNVITVHVGYGRQRAGRVGNKVGTDVYPLRTSQTMWFAVIKRVQKTGRTYPLATTQHHYDMAGRDLVRAGTLSQYQDAPNHPPFMAEHGHSNPELSLYPEWKYEGYKWGMVVNQSACIGCNACVVACQAENNIPVVGKDQVARGREMHWLRIDNYYAAEPENPIVYHQPVLCMHCEYAPCEPVCPVAATSHSNEGLNEMTYNRCIGTRYCSNNCPYKVRRFNFYDYNAELRQEATRQLRPNPDVTIRSRGVMEKCTYCVQRINAGRIAADKEDRLIRDGEVVTACQAACPTQALTFGNLNDPNSAVRELADSNLNYSLLGELNTRPRTTYLAALRNPHPALEKLNHQEDLTQRR
ncbi:MAG: 4Fe-4S dicluster domain-containing protein [Pirellulales bacterium]